MKPLTIVALAIVAALGLALGLNVTSEPETKTAYTTAADLTPTIEHETVSNWAPLSPASNWTGFYPYSNYGFTMMPDNTYNRYPVQPSADPEVTVWNDIRVKPYTETANRVTYFDFGDGTLGNATMKKVSAGQSVSTATHKIYRKAIDSFTETWGTNRVTVEFDVPCAVPLSGNMVYSNSGVQMNLRVCGSFGSSLQYMAQKVVYTPPESGSGAYYSGFNGDGAPVWVVAADDPDFTVFALWGGDFVTGFPLAGTTGGYSNSVLGPGPDPRTATVTVIPKLDEPVVYMDIRDGITGYPTIPNENQQNVTLNWSNGYVNGSITMVVLLSSGAFGVRDAETHRYLFSYFKMGGTDEATFSGINGELITLGNANTTYRAAEVTIDAINQEFRVSPILNFIDFQNYSGTPATYTQTGGSYSPIRTLEMFTSNVPGNPYIFGITKTIVATDPNELLWLNPVIESNHWFPQLTMQPYSIYFRSGVTYGDSITINNQTFATSPTGYITVDGTQYPITGMSIDYPAGAANGHVWLRLAKGTHPVSFDLGTVESSRITASGIWYAQIDLRTISTETQDVIKYDADGWDQADAKTILVLFMAICTGLAMWAMRSHEFSSGGIATVIIALVIAWITLGVFI